MYEKYLDENYKPTPYERLKAHLGTYVTVTAIVFGITAVSSLLPDNAVFNVINDFIRILMQFGLIWFFYNAIKSNKPSVNDFFAPYNSALLPKMLAIGIVEFLINTAVNFATEALADIPAIGFAAGIILALITTLFLPVKYLFAINQGYPTATYFKKAVAYMTDYIFKYYGIVLKYIALLFLVIMLVLFLNIIGVIIGIPAAMLVLMVMEIEITEFMLNIIPEEWYLGVSAE